MIKILGAHCPTNMLRRSLPIRNALAETTMEAIAANR